MGVRGRDAGETASAGADRPEGLRVLVVGSSPEAVARARDLWDRGAAVSLSFARPPALVAPWRLRPAVRALLAHLPRALAGRLDWLGRRDLRAWDWPLPEPDGSSVHPSLPLVDEGMRQLVRQGAVIIYPAETKREAGPDGTCRVTFSDGRADTFDLILPRP